MTNPKTDDEYRAALWDRSKDELIDEIMDMRAATEPSVLSCHICEPTPDEDPRYLCPKHEEEFQRWRAERR